MRKFFSFHYSIFDIRYSIFFFLFFSLPLTAQYARWFADLAGESMGSTACGFLTLPISGGSLSMNDAARPSMGDATDLPSLPAASAYFNRYNFAITHLEWLMGLRKEYAAAAFPILEIGTVGVFSQLFTAGDFGPSRNIDELAEDPSYVEYAIGASFARPVVYPWLSAGASASYVESRLDRIIGRTACASAGLTLRAPWIDAHLYAANLGPRITYAATPEALPAQAGCAVTFAPLEEHFRLKNRFTFAISAGAQKTADEPLTVGAAAEAKLLGMIAARAGYAYRYRAKPGIEGLSLGVGVRALDYGADFGWKYQSEDLGAVWALTALAKVHEVKPKNAMEYYQIAEKRFRQGLLNTALWHARRALLLDPNLWKAHALIARIMSLKRRRQQLEIALIYTGGCRGNFIPMMRGEGTIGGLARQARVIEELRGQYAVSVAINTGNNIAGPTNLYKTNLARAYYEKVQFNAIAYGSGELDFDSRQGKRAEAASGAKMVCSNLANAAVAEIMHSQIVTAGPYRLYVAAIIGAGAPSEAASRAKIAPENTALKKVLDDPQAASCHLRIAVVDDSWENVRTLAASTPNLDIVLCSGLSQQFEAPLRVGACLVLSAGDSGACVGALTLRFDQQGKLLSWSNRLIPLTNGVGSDPQLERMADEIAMTLELEEKGIAADSIARGSIDGTFAFVSNRRGAAHIYLKVIRALAEFPLTSGAPCSSPALSFASGRIAFLRPDSADQKSRLWVMRTNGTGQRMIALRLHASAPAFSLDGQWIYFGAVHAQGGGAGIYRVKSDGTLPVKIADVGATRFKDFSFSPDGAEMAFAAYRDGFWRLYVASPQGERPICITEGKYVNAKPKYSPDGRQIAYLTDRGSVYQRLDLWVYDRYSGRVFQETHGADVEDFCWLSDSRSIVFSAGRERKKLYRINVFTAETIRLIESVDPKSGEETTPRTIMHLGDEKIIYTRVYSDGEREIFWVDPEGSNNGPVVRSAGKDWLE